VWDVKPCSTIAAIYIRLFCCVELEWLWHQVGHLQHWHNSMWVGERCRAISGYAPYSGTRQHWQLLSICSTKCAYNGGNCQLISS